MERLKKIHSPKGRLGFLSPFQLHELAPWIASNIVRRGPTDAMPVVLGYRSIKEGCVTLGKSKNIGVKLRRVFLNVR